MKFPLISYIDFALQFLPLGAVLYRRPALKGDVLIFFIFIVVGTIAEILEYSTAIRGINNLVIAHLYVLTGSILLLVLYAEWQKRYRMKIFLWLLAVLFAIFWLYEKLLLEGFHSTTPYTLHVSSVIFIVLTAITLLKLIREGEVSLGRNMRFWISTGLLVYSAGNIVLFLLGDTLRMLSFKDMLTAWKIHWSLDIVSMLCYTGAFLCSSRKA
jgi:hypothetical protein